MVLWVEIFSQIVPEPLNITLWTSLEQNRYSYHQYQRWSKYIGNIATQVKVELEISKTNGFNSTQI